MQRHSLHQRRYGLGAIASAVALISRCVGPRRAAAQGQPSSTPVKGRILYDQYCIPCHGHGGVPGSAVFVSSNHRSRAIQGPDHPPMERRELRRVHPDPDVEPVAAVAAAGLLVSQGGSLRSTCLGGLLLAVGAALAVVGMARAQSRDNLGARDLYVRYCADCHGTSGHGDGAAAADLKPPPSDLTRSTLSRDELIRVIDGRQPLKGHGGASMPQWSSLFESQAGMAGQRTSEIRIAALADEVLRLREAAPAPKSPAASQPR